MVQPRTILCGRRPGFTLIEVLVSLVILSVGIVLVLRAFGSATVALGEAHDTFWRSMLIKQKSSDILLEANNGSAPGSSSGRFTDLPGSYSWDVKTRQISSVSRPGAKPGEVEVLQEVSIDVWRQDGRHQAVTTYVRTIRNANR
ncbi:MAG: hypothetical protein C0404_07455 [Verrucomicrobia bacterium]|nr:hypothetical protein [Verrucomicrobiota bacterium]